MSTLEDAKNAKLAQLVPIATEKLALWTGDHAPSGGVQLDDTSMLRLATWRARAALEQDAPEFWIMADNTIRSFWCAADFVEFVDSCVDYKASVILNNSRLKTAIRNAADTGALAAIDINQGWPL